MIYKMLTFQDLIHALKIIPTENTIDKEKEKEEVGGGTTTTTEEGDKGDAGEGEKGAAEKGEKKEEGKGEELNSTMGKFKSYLKLWYI